MKNKKQNPSDFNSLPFNQIHLLDKKNNIQKENLSFIFKLASALFIAMFLVSFYSSIPVKPEEQFHVSTQINPANNLKSHNIEVPKSATLNATFNPDLTIPYIFNYKTVQKIDSSKKVFRDYLKTPDFPINFESFASLNSMVFYMKENNLLSSLDNIKHNMFLEDLSIVPFKSGTVNIESEIIETTQSENYYMIEVLKTFTQGNQVVKVLEKKVFQLQSLEKGEMIYFKNILLTSSKDTNK